MIKALNTFHKITDCFVDETFSLSKWEKYICSIDQRLKEILLEDVRKDEVSGLDLLNDQRLPIVESVIHQLERAKSVQVNFDKICKSIDSTVKAIWNVELDLTIILYLGLANAAGWFTTIGDEEVILLGIEKILELNWEDYETMESLIYHELSHAYHRSYCNIEASYESTSDNLLWQLYIEGVAMVLEQELKQDAMHFHQFDTKTLQYLKTNIQKIANDFYMDMNVTEPTPQRWFGDWVSYEGIGDVGYFLGAAFIRFILKTHTMIDMMRLDILQLRNLFLLFLASFLKN